MNTQLRCGVEKSAATLLQPKNAQFLNFFFYDTFYISKGAPHSLPLLYHVCFFFIHFEWYWCCWTIFEALNNHLWAFIRLSVKKIDSFWGRLKSVAYIRLDEKKVEHYSIHILASWKWWNNQTTRLHPKYIYIHCISFLLAFFKSRL